MLQVKCLHVYQNIINTLWGEINSQEKHLLTEPEFGQRNSVFDLLSTLINN